ncbi:MAG: hypothetical protein WCC64_07840, partial [Aliidongia sp.]
PSQVIDWATFHDTLWDFADPEGPFLAAVSPERVNANLTALTTSLPPLETWYPDFADLFALPLPPADSLESDSNALTEAATQRIIAQGQADAETHAAAIAEQFARTEAARFEEFAFDFLGFTFISGKSRQGKFLIHRKSRRDRVQAKLTKIKAELRRRMHEPIRETAEWLKQVVTGYFQYHAVPTNGPAIGAFRYHVIDLWRRTLRRRGQKHRMTWRRMGKLADDWLPKPRILHPWPNQRFAVKHPRSEPYAGKPHVRICAGGAQ